MKAQAFFCLFLCWFACRCDGSKARKALVAVALGPKSLKCYRCWPPMGCGTLAFSLGCWPVLLWSVGEGLEHEQLGAARKAYRSFAPSPRPRARGLRYHINYRTWASAGGWARNIQGRHRPHSPSWIRKGVRGYLSGWPILPCKREETCSRTGRGQERRDFSVRREN